MFVCCSCDDIKSLALAAAASAVAEDAADFDAAAAAAVAAYLACASAVAAVAAVVSTPLVHCGLHWYSAQPYFAAFAAHPAGTKVGCQRQRSCFISMSIQCVCVCVSYN